MSSRTGIRALVAATVTAILLGSAALPAHSADGDPVAADLTTTYETDLSTTVTVGDGPAGLVVDAAGTTAYVANDSGPSIAVVDLASGEKVRSFQVGRSPGDVALSRDEKTLYVSTFEPATGGTYLVQAFDVASGSLLGSFPVKGWPQGLTTSLDDSHVYALGLSGSLYEVSATTFEVERTLDFGDANVHEIAVHPTNGKIYVSHTGTSSKPVIRVVDAATLTLASTIPLVTGSEVGSMELSADGTTLIVSTGNSHGIQAIDVASETVTVNVTGVGSYLYGVTISPDGTRAYGVSNGWGSVLSVDLTTGKRVEVSRTVEEGAFELVQVPATGDLVVTNRSDDTIQIIHPPSVADPADQDAEIGATVTFSTTTRGIETPSWGSLQWQQSTDGGATWEDIAGATGQDLVVTASESLRDAQFRAAWTDRFWNAAETTAPALLRLPAAGVAPVITSGDLPAGQIGADYSFTVTATGDPEPTFAAEGLPDGLTIDPLTGVVSGIPTVEGTFVVTVTATNSEGTDVKVYTVVVSDEPVVTEPEPGDPEEPGAPGPEKPVLPEVPEGPAGPGLKPSEPGEQPAPEESPAAVTPVPVVAPPVPAPTSTPSGGGTLAATGSGALPVGALGAAALLLGLGAVVAVRRSRA